MNKHLEHNMHTAHLRQLRFYLAWPTPNDTVVFVRAGILGLNKAWFIVPGSAREVAEQLNAQRTHTLQLNPRIGDLEWPSEPIYVDLSYDVTAEDPVNRVEPSAELLKNLTSAERDLFFSSDTSSSVRELLEAILDNRKQRWEEEEEARQHLREEDES